MMYVFGCLNSPQSLAGLVLLLLVYSAIDILTRNYLGVRNLKRQRIDVPILNLEGDDYDAANKRYINELKYLLQLGYSAVQAWHLSAMEHAWLYHHCFARLSGGAQCTSC